MKIKIVLFVVGWWAFGSPAAAQTRVKAVAPNVIVKNLYAAQKAGLGPFFQTKNRAAVDKYFTPKFADLIWNDAIRVKGKIGPAIDFDPLYGLQTPKVTDFNIMDTGWGGDESKFGSPDEAVVQVTFKESGAEKMVSFEFKQSRDKSWKIYDIRYREGGRLLNILSAVAGEVQANAGVRKVDFLNYSYQPAAVCSEDSGFPATVKVSKGEFKIEDNFYSITRQEIGYGDLNADGNDDAVVQIRCGSSAGTYRAFELHAYTFQNGAAKFLTRLDSSVLETDYKKSYPSGVIFFPTEKAPKIQNGHLIVQAYTDGSFASPKNTATFDYKLSGGKFVLSGKPTRKRRTE